MTWILLILLHESTTFLTQLVSKCLMIVKGEIMVWLVFLLAKAFHCEKDLSF
jgi:hypothetical protein